MIDGAIEIARAEVEAWVERTGHPHDGYSYDGCSCSHCVGIRTGNIDHWIGHPTDAYQREVREDERFIGYELGGEA